MKTTSQTALSELNAEVVRCRICPRLVRFRENLPPRKAFTGQEYWRKPLPGFGDPNAWLLIVGLAPAAHGGNRTGRVFTGDASAKFLVRVMFKAGLANQPTSLARDDGLRLIGCYITAAVRCVPPGDRPTSEEFRNCSVYMWRELELLRNIRAVVVLGGSAFKAYLEYSRNKGFDARRSRFVHGARYEMAPLPPLYCAYHPSPRNVNTGKLTEKMLLDVFRDAGREVDGAAKEIAE
jgi:uracil-DNA glycosylase family 4